MTEIFQKEAYEPVGDMFNPTKTARMLLRLLRADQPISRIEIARRLGVNRSTISEIVKSLVSAEILLESSIPNENSEKTMGRPPIGLFLNKSKDLLIGLNLGVRHTQVGISTIKGEILAEEEFLTPSDPSTALKKSRQKMEYLCKGFNHHAFRNIGVSVPGLTDPEGRKLIYAPHLNWSDVEIAENLVFNNLPVIVENDSTAAAMFEARIKLGRSRENSLKNFILVRSGTGIGVGLVIDNEIYRGTGNGRGSAGEFGHMTIMANGKLCVCGNRGCWEKYASASSAAMLYTGERAPHRKTDKPRFIEIVGRADAGETKAIRTLEKIGEYLGIGIANVIMGLGVHQVVVSGRLVYGWKYISEPLYKSINKSIVGKTSKWEVFCGEPKGSALGGALEVAYEDFINYRIKI